jgi:hypothetical protein
MALTAAQLVLLHRRLDVLAEESPDLVEKLAAFLEAVDDDEPPDPVEEPSPLIPAGSAA